MKRIAVYSLLLMMFVLSGCPVLTKNSIDNGSYEVPEWLTGKWYEYSATGKYNSGYLFEKDATKGRLKCYDIDSVGKVDRTHVRAVILSSVAGKLFMNVYTPPDDMSEEGFYLFEMRKVNSGEFVLASLMEHSIDYDASQKEIVHYIETNKDGKGFYEPKGETTYVKR